MIEVGVTFSIILVQKLTMIVASLVIAFLFSWKLALVLSCLLPFLLFFSYFLIKVSQEHTVHHCIITLHHACCFELGRDQCIHAFFSTWLCLLLWMYSLKAISYFAEKEQDALMFASSVAEESLQSIETVKIFEGEHKEMNRLVPSVY